MGKLLPFPGDTCEPVPVEWILDKAKEWNLSGCLILGETQDGEFMFGGTNCGIGYNLFLMEMAKKRMMEVTDEEEE